MARAAHRPRPLRALGRAASDGRSTLVSEARVAPTDRVGAMRLRSLWLVVGPFERLIGAEPLALAAAEAAAGLEGAAGVG